MSTLGELLRLNDLLYGEGDLRDQITAGGAPAESNPFELEQVVTDDPQAIGANVIDALNTFIKIRKGRKLGPGALDNLMRQRQMDVDRRNMSEMRQQARRDKIDAEAREAERSMARGRVSERRAIDAEKRQQKREDEVFEKKRKVAEEANTRELYDDLLKANSVVGADISGVDPSDPASIASGYESVGKKYANQRGGKGRDRRADIEASALVEQILGDVDEAAFSDPKVFAREMEEALDRIGNAYRGDPEGAADAKAFAARWFGRRKPDPSAAPQKSGRGVAGFLGNIGTAEPAPKNTIGENITGVLDRIGEIGKYGPAGLLIEAGILDLPKDPPPGIDPIDWATMDDSLKKQILAGM